MVTDKKEKKDKKKGTFWADFKKFITKGNVIDMAVGVVIGGAFGKIVTGLVNYIINPVVSLISGNGDLNSLKTVLVEPVKAADAVLDDAGAVVTPAIAEVKEVAILWGTWIQTILDFLIVAFCIFIVLRLIVKAKTRLEAKKAAEDKKNADEAAAKADIEKKASAERQKLIEDSLLNQEKLLGEMCELMKKK